MQVLEHIDVEARDRNARWRPWWHSLEYCRHTSFRVHAQDCATTRSGNIDRSVGGDCKSTKIKVRLPHPFPERSHTLLRGGSTPPWTPARADPLFVSFDLLCNTANHRLPEQDRSTM